MQLILAVEPSDLRLALQLYLDTEPGLFVVGIVAEAASLRSLLQTAHPDLVILDWNLPGYAPIHLLAEAKQLRHCPQVIVLGRDKGVGQEALAAGADAFVLSGDSTVDLIVAVRESQVRHRAGAAQAAASG